MDCPPVVLAGMIVRTIVFSRRNPISVILGRGGRARARRSEDQTLPTPFCTAAATPEYPVTRHTSDLACAAAMAMLSRGPPKDRPYDWESQLSEQQKRTLGDLGEDFPKLCCGYGPL